MCACYFLSSTLAALRASIQTDSFIAVTVLLRWSALCSGFPPGGWSSAGSADWGESIFNLVANGQGFRDEAIACWVIGSGQQLRIFFLKFLKERGIQPYLSLSIFQSYPILPNSHSLDLLCHSFDLFWILLDTDTLYRFGTATV